MNSRLQSGFHRLGPDQQRAAILALTDAGMSDHEIANLTGLALGQVRAVIASRISASPVLAPDQVR